MAPLLAIVAAGAALRVFWALAYPFSFDESFTAMAGRRAVAAIPAYLRDHDVHPPLDYLLRAPLAALGASDTVFRAPSVLLSAAALALFAWWMRDRGRVGLIATALLAVSPFQIGYGSEARMYAVLELVGIAAAVIGERWIRSPARWHGPAVAGVLAIGLFDHVSAFLLAAGLLALAGLRTDRDAWRWRSWTLGAVGVWLVVWGPAFARQRSGAEVARIPPTSVGRFLDAIANSVTFTNGVALLLVAAVAAGGFLLVRTDPALGRVWLALGAVPFVLGAGLGLFAHFFMDRSLTVAAWAPVLAVAWLADRAIARSLVGRAAAVVVLLLLVVPGTVAFLGGTWSNGVSADHVREVARPGDVVAVVPAWYHQLIDWEIGVHGPDGSRSVRVPGIDDARGVLVGPRRIGHRTWLLTLAANAATYERFPRCAPDRTVGSERVLCLVTEG